MPIPELQHLRPTLVGDVTLIEILTRNLQGPRAGLELGGDLARILDDDGPRPILLDFGGAAFMGSSTYAALFKLVKQAHAAGRVVKFCGMAPGILAGAEVVGLPKLVEIHADRTAGLRSFATE